MTVEHALPVSRGGARGFENHAVACKACNRRRGNTPLLVWLLALRRVGGDQKQAQRFCGRLQRAINAKSQRKEQD